MNERTDLDRMITGWLRSDAPTSAPEHLLTSVVAAAEGVRPMPAWRASVTTSPMHAPSAVLVGAPRLRAGVMLLALILVTAAATALVAAGATLLRSALPTDLQPLPTDPQPTTVCAFMPVTALQPILGRDFRAPEGTLDPSGRSWNGAEIVEIGAIVECRFRQTTSPSFSFDPGHYQGWWNDFTVNVRIDGADEPTALDLARRLLGPAEPEPGAEAGRLWVSPCIDIDRETPVGCERHMVAWDGNHVAIVLTSWETDYTASQLRALGRLVLQYLPALDGSG